MSTTAAANAEWIASIIHGYLADPRNRAIAPGFSEPAFSAPLIGFAGGSDPVFRKLKDLIGSFYWTPADIFGLTFPEHKCVAASLAVVSWILPQTEATKKAHRRCKKYPSRRWTLVRLHGEEVNAGLRRHLADRLSRKGFPALAPMLSPLWRQEHSRAFGMASSWSERHAAYACGLGTFGLSDGLITAKGKAVRIGSIVARIELPPTPRPYQDHNAYCLYHAHGKCGKCVKRCPAGAISLNGHDKEKCKRYIRTVTALYARSRQTGVAVSSCGLCQTAVPCESAIPVK
jgi:epoxyqueuosine reductase QueG